jgi:C4-dicarboxylate transporter DctM subunit
MLTAGIVGSIIFLILLVTGVPIAFSLITVGLIGTIAVVDLSAALSQLTMLFWGEGTNFTVLCIPMFVLMGTIVYHSGMAVDIYDCLEKFVGQYRGGLAIASVWACGAFGAMTGSSVACVSTMGTIILPQMIRYNYDKRLSTGVLAASGTLAILIPPSLGFVFYGILTDTSIGALFIAGIIPGIITIFLFSFFITIRCRLNPTLGPPSISTYGWREKMVSLNKMWAVVSIFLLIIGGLYLGVFTPTEASGVGVVGVAVIGFIKKKLTWSNLKPALEDTGIISSMIYLIIVGGFLFARFLAVTQITENVVHFMQDLNLNKYVFILAITILYLILGCLLDIYGMMILTIPFILPIASSFGIDFVWLGVYIVIMCEIALVTPPVGINVYVMHSIAKGISPTPMETIFRGSFPFVLLEILLVIILVLFPKIALWLPSIGFGK